MNTSRTTPGPWTVDDISAYDSRKEHVDEGYHYIDAGKGFLDDATGLGFGLGGCISLADARLIAAAPDLYEAVSLAEVFAAKIDRCLGAGFEDMDLGLACDARQLISRLQSAIAKAEGK